MAGMAEMAWEQKKTNVDGSGTNTQGPKHHPLIANQYRKGGPTIKGFKGCGLVVGEKGSILGFLPRLLLGKLPCWDGILPKRGKQKAGTHKKQTLIHLGRGNDPNPYPFG